MKLQMQEMSRVTRYTQVNYSKSFLASLHIFVVFLG
ncbi:Uncharacterised protein [Vibrio cholerae]|nr:Uncharacterised protein [Vibrio cholerae]CSA99734.1 Uncharacterised protein [Vibrio cholerae]CSB27487.1 Uncharacterised protein [Vibrio cholerae]CSC81931.1 Uncharacterised protein [Vibrio cholerae]